jgi:hypothetical protein
VKPGIGGHSCFEFPIWIGDGDFDQKDQLDTLFMGLNEFGSELSLG